MDIWLLGAGLLIIGLIPCGILMASAPLMDRLVAFEMANVVSILIMMLLAQSYRQPSFHDLALTLSLPFSRFLQEVAQMARQQERTVLDLTPEKLTLHGLKEAAGCRA